MLPSLVQGNRDSYGKRTTLLGSPISKGFTEKRNEEMKILPKMFDGYLKFQSLRRNSCTLLVGENNFKSWNPEKTLFEKFAVLFDNAEKSYNTFKAYGHIKNIENIILADGGYIKLDETYKFFANSMDVNVDPQQLAKIFLQCFTFIAKVVVPAMKKVGADDFSMVAIYALCLFKEDVADISDKTRETISKIKEEIIRDLHIYYRNKGIEETEVTIKICKILLLIPTLEHVGRLFHENFYLVDLFSMLDVPIAYKK
uniref:NR LBD domain-containing protein n=1 Tax=Panagrolaimus sp. ES5 TaxID=591445 RepID=A0AC34GYE6_9BILA